MTARGTIVMAAFLLSAGCSGPSGTPASPVQPTSAAPTPVVPLQLSVWVGHTTGWPCAGCLVEITSGPGAGASAATGSVGPSFGNVNFQIPVPGAVTLRVSKDGYRVVDDTVEMDRSRSTTFRTITIESVLPPIDLSGSGVLELRADAACSQLPPEVRTRTYPVSVVKQDRGFRFFPVEDVFKDFLMWAGVSGNDVAIIIENWANEQEGIVEQLSSGHVLKIQAWTEVFPVSNGCDTISRTIEGTISYCDASSRCSVVCESKNHQLTLTRR